MLRITIQYTQLGAPDQGAYIEHFNRTYRAEDLNQYLSLPLADVRGATWRFLIDDNEHQPHDSLDGMTPVEYRRHL